MEPVVYLVDDDAAIRDAFAMLFRSIGLKVKAYDHPQGFLQEFRHETIGCLVLDIRMPGISGMAVHEQLVAGGCQLPVIFITGHGDVAQCRAAFRNGAMDFLAKPVDEQPLLDSVQKAIQHSINQHQAQQQSASAKARFEQLTEREREVCDLIVAGMTNKLIAKQLDLSLRTVENHRAAIFGKMQAGSLAGLVKMYLIQA